MSNLAPFVGACAALLTALGTLAATLRNARKIQEVHVIVNQRMTDVLARVDQLTEALKAEGQDIPDDPAVQGSA
jgi:hypothetical protein